MKPEKHSKAEEAKETKGKTAKQKAAHMRGKEEMAEKMVKGYKCGGAVKKGK